MQLFLRLMCPKVPQVSLPFDSAVSTRVSWVKESQRGSFYKGMEWQDKGWWFQAERGEIYVRDKAEIVHSEGGEALAQISQRSCGCPLPGRVQSRAGWGYDQAALVEGVPAHGREVGIRWSSRSLPTQIILLLCDSMLSIWFSSKDLQRFS